MAARVKCIIHKNEENAPGHALAVPDTLEALLAKADQKLGISGAKTLYNAAGLKITELDNIAEDDVIYVAVGDEPFFRNNKKRSAGKGVESYKIAVLGGGGVGKSCITMRFCRSIFIDVYDPTIEDSLTRNLTYEGLPVTLDILDTAGQDDFIVLRRQWIEDRDGFILVYSVADRTTLDAGVKSFVDLIKEVKGASYDKTPVVLVGNKIDLGDERVVSDEQGRTFLTRFLPPSAVYLGVSALTGTNVSEVFHEIIKQFRKFSPPKPKKTSICTLI